MLPTRRVTAVLLLGLGTLLAAWGLFAPFMLHQDGRLSLGLGSLTYTLEDPGAVVAGEPTGMTRQRHVELMEPADADTVTLRIGNSDVKFGTGSDLERLATASVWSYRIDRTTGRALSAASVTNQLASPPTEVTVDGVWVKFPTGTESSEYQVFDPLLRAARPAVLVGEEERNGRIERTYRQEIPPTNVATLYADLSNTSVDEEGNQSYRYHQATRTFVVDKETGVIVDMQVEEHDYYGDRTGAEVTPLLIFNAGIDEVQQAQLRQQAASIPNGFVLGWVHWSFVAFGAVFILIGVVGTFGGWDRRRRQQ